MTSINVVVTYLRTATAALRILLILTVVLGIGYPLLVLHGGPGLDHHEFADYLDPLAGEHRLVLVDQRAQGRSAPCDPATWTLGRMAADVTALASAPFPVTMIWGLCDTVAPPRVASYVWNRYLMLKPGANRLYFVPDANHYLQADRPGAFVSVLLHALGADGGHGPGALGPEPGAPLLVDTSRGRLPAAADLLRAPQSAVS